jgi:hypothetical protein
MRPGVPDGATASLIGVGFQEIARFIKEPEEGGGSAIRLGGHHIHLDVADWTLPSLEIGVDIVALGGAAAPVGVQGVGLRHDGGGQVILPFAGLFRGAGAAIWGEAALASSGAAAGAYAVTGFAYSSRSLSIGGGIAATVVPGLWYRRRCSGDPSGLLTIGGITKPDLAVAAPPGTAEDFALFCAWMRANGDNASLMYGGWRLDDSDESEEQGVAESLNITATATDREIMLGLYNGGAGTATATWSHIHVTDSPAGEAP